MADEQNKNVQDAAAGASVNPPAAAEAAVQNPYEDNAGVQAANPQPYAAGVPVATPVSGGPQASGATRPGATQPGSAVPPFAQTGYQAPPFGQPGGQHGTYANSGRQAPVNNGWNPAPANPVPTYAQPGMGYAQASPNPASAGLSGGMKFGWLVVGFLLNIPGMLIAWLTNADKHPQVKHDAIMWAVIGFGIGVVLNIVLFTTVVNFALAGIGGITEVYASSAYL